MRGEPPEQNRPENRACRLADDCMHARLLSDRKKCMHLLADVLNIFLTSAVLCTQGSGLGTVNGAENTAGIDI